MDTDGKLTKVEELGLDTAIEGFKALHAYLTCQSQNTPLDRWLRDKAKAGAAAVSGYTRLYASKTNRESVQIAAARAGGIGRIGRAEIKALKA